MKCIIDRVKFARRWNSVEKHKIPEKMPENTELLIMLESGKIRRYDEDWEDEREMVAYWKIIKTKKI
jgi:hypothetical protein